MSSQLSSTEAMICMECSQSKIWQKHLLVVFFLLLVVFFLLLVILLSLSLSGLVTTLRGLGVTGLFAWPLTEPLGQPGLGPLGPLAVLILPHRLEPLGPEHLSASLVQLLPLAVGPGVCPPLVLGEHVNCGRVGSTKGLGIQTLLDGLISHLQFLSLLKLFHFIVLIQLSLLIVVFVCLKSENAFPNSSGLGFQLVRQTNT